MVGRCWPIRANRLPVLEIIARQPPAGYVNIGEMPRKKRPKRFRAVEAVKAMAREQIGTPPAARVVPNRKKKKERHKTTLGKLLEET